MSGYVLPDCPTCKGTGQVAVGLPSNGPDPCEDCDRTGKVSIERCIAIARAVAEYEPQRWDDLDPFGDGYDDAIRYLRTVKP